MKKKFTFLIAALFALTLITHPLKVFAEDIEVTYYFTDSDNYSINTTTTTITYDDNTESATFTYSVTGTDNCMKSNGIQWGGNKTDAGTITITTSAYSTYVIKQVDINATSSAGYNATVSVGSTSYTGASTNSAFNSTAHTNTYTGNSSGNLEIVLSQSSTKKNVIVKTITITYTTSSTITYTMSYDANGGTGTVPTDSNSPYNSGATVTVLGNIGSPALSKDHYTFNGWNTKADGTGTTYTADNTFTISQNTTLYAKWNPKTNTVTLPTEDDKGTYTMDKTNPVAYNTEVTLTYTPKSGCESYEATWSVNGSPISGNKFTMPDASVTVSVSVVEVHWVLTDLDKLTGGDEFVIVGTITNGSDEETYAIPNDDYTDAPDVVSVTLTGSGANITFASAPADNIKWNLSKTDKGYTFYPSGDASKWLYCNTNSGSSNNNNERIGTGGRNIYILNNSNYLVTNDTYSDRYLSVYVNNSGNAVEWRGYLNTSNHPAAISFFKKETNNTSLVKTITGCGSGSDNNLGYYLIASPVVSVTPTYVNGFLTIYIASTNLEKMVNGKITRLMMSLHLLFLAQATFMQAKKIHNLSLPANHTTATDLLD